MNLKNQQITLGEIIENGNARAALRREYPMLCNMTLQSALFFARGNMPPAQLRRLLSALERS